jgi:hypothetical protein
MQVLKLLVAVVVELLQQVQMQLVATIRVMEVLALHGQLDQVHIMLVAVAVVAVVPLAVQLALEVEV